MESKQQVNHHEVIARANAVNHKAISEWHNNFVAAGNKAIQSVHGKGTENIIDHITMPKQGSYNPNFSNGRF